MLWPLSVLELGDSEGVRTYGHLESMEEGSITVVPRSTSLSTVSVHEECDSI